MSVLEKLNTLLSPMLSVGTGVFSGVSDSGSPVPDEYCVLTPLADRFALFGDNKPQIEVSEVRLSLFCKGNYNKRKSQITQALLAADFTITDRRYVGYEPDTNYYHYAIDVAQENSEEEGF